MEDELNYLKEKISSLGREIKFLEKDMKVAQQFGAGLSAYKVLVARKEKQLLENLLNHVTITAI